MIHYPNFWNFLKYFTLCYTLNTSVWLNFNVEKNIKVDINGGNYQNYELRRACKVVNLFQQLNMPQYMGEGDLRCYLQKSFMKTKRYSWKKEHFDIFSSSKYKISLLLKKNNFPGRILYPSSHRHLTIDLFLVVLLILKDDEIELCIEATPEPEAKRSQSWTLFRRWLTS